MYENNEEESDFWSRVPDSRLDRFRLRRRTSPPRTAARPAARPAGSRSHLEHHTGQIPAVAAPVVHTVRDAASQVDPLLRRAGGLAVVVALLVPVALALRSEDGADRTAAVASAGLVAPDIALAADTAVAAPASAASTASSTKAAATGQVANPFATIDVNALPPAVPAHPDSTAESNAGTSAAAATTSSAGATTKVVTTKPSTHSSSTARATTCGNSYRVRPGDAWILIAQRAKVSLSKLLAANGAASSTPLYPGRTICLPAGASVPAASSGGSSSGGTPSTTQPPSGPTYTPPSQTYTKEQVRQIIRAVWPDSLEDEAIRIATRESNLVPTARNSCCSGLFQIYWSVHKRWLSSIGITSAGMLLDPRVNAYAAYVMYQRSGGWGPWS